MGIQPEDWKPVVGYEGLYEVSNTGKVRSLTRTYVNSRGQTRVAVGKVLTPDEKKTKNVTSNMYQRVTLTSNGKSKHKSIHRLVAEAFVPNESAERNQINHIDCDKTNNNVDNLEWCTSKENIMHSVSHGLAKPNPPKGENAVFSKLSNRDVREMRQTYDSGMFTAAELADQYGVTECTARNAIFGRSYTAAGEMYPPCCKRSIPNGSDHPSALLTDDDVVTIRERYSNGEAQTSIAEDYKVSVSTIWRIVNNLRYN